MFSPVSRSLPYTDESVWLLIDLSVWSAPWAEIFFCLSLYLLSQGHKRFMHYDSCYLICFKQNIAVRQDERRQIKERFLNIFILWRKSC